jgi:hypothetical protein
MSILNIIWKTGPPYRLWAKGNVQLTAQVIRPLRNHVYYARIGTTGTKATQAIALKIAHGVQEFMGMEREVEFYEHELKNLQGTVVPRMHGFFRGTTIDLIVAGCMLLEFCEGPMPVNLIVRKYVV